MGHRFGVWDEFFYKHKFHWKSPFSELKIKCRLKYDVQPYPEQYMISLLITNNFSADLSPQDSTLLSDIVEIGPLPSFTREDEGTRYAFYVLTRQGLRYECSSISKTQVCRVIWVSLVICCLLCWVEWYLASSTSHCPQKYL
jgi:hypothetical protein